MTEADAKTRWCPFARFVFGASDYPAGNRFEGESSTAAEAAERCLCIASDCMAWRTRSIRSHEHNVTKSGVEISPPKDTVTLDGFCGLAGPIQ